MAAPNPELAALPDLYLRDTRNRAFIEGVSSRTYDTGKFDISALATTICVLVGVMIFFAAKVYLAIDFYGYEPILLIASPIIVCVVFIQAVQFYRQRRLEREGTLIRGEILDYDRWETQSGDDGTISKALLCYHFSDSHGLRITATRIDGGYLARPERERESVAILYVNEHLFDVL